MTPVRPITADKLVALGACRKQVDLFRKTFPRGTPRTPRGFMRAAKYERQRAPIFARLWIAQEAAQ